MPVYQIRSASSHQNSHRNIIEYKMPETKEIKLNSKRNSNDSNSKLINLRLYTDEKSVNSTSKTITSDFKNPHK